MAFWDTMNRIHLRRTGQQIPTAPEPPREEAYAPLQDEEPPPDPRGCPGCNSDAILPKLDELGLLPWRVAPEAEGEGAVVCDVCGKCWTVFTLAEFKGLEDGQE